MENKYPIVLISDQLKYIEYAEPEKPIEPRRPARPSEPSKPIPPIEPTKPDSFGQSWGKGLLLIIIFIFIVVGISNSEVFFDMITGSFLVVIFVILLPIIGISTIYSYQNNQSLENDSYDKKMQEYRKALDKYRHEKEHYLEDYKRKVVHFENTSLLSYEIEKEDYEREIQQLLTPENLLIYRKEKIREYFEESKSYFWDEDNYLRGVSEESFYDYLTEKSDKFLRNTTVNLNYEMNKYYMPDLIYFDEDTGVVVDIEIDEPYVGKDGTPIHYIGRDDKRNEFFTDIGWVVIRFAEEQVIKFPEECYNFIICVVDKILNVDFDFKCDNMSTVNQWTKEDAHKMAFQRYRNSYLPRPLVESMEDEINFDNGNHEPRVGTSGSSDSIYSDYDYERPSDDLPF